MIPACRRCSSAPCARIPPTPRCRATGCSCAPATSAAPRPASTPGCRWADGCCATSSRSCARRWTRSARQEVHFPALLPREPFEATGRWTEYGDCSSGSRTARADYLLGPTHEEMFTLLVKGQYSSYKDLPLLLFQIQTKYRDEARPRAGILRGREFVMKDSYSFDIDDAGLRASYEAHRDAYNGSSSGSASTYRIVFGGVRRDGRLGLRGVPGPAANGEDTFVQCTNAATPPTPRRSSARRRPRSATTTRRPPRVEDTPDTPDDRHAGRAAQHTRTRGPRRSPRPTP